MRHIVLGDDRTDGSDLGWLWINSQRWPGWRLVVLTAHAPPIGTVVPAERSAPHPVEGPPPRPVYDEPGFEVVEFREAVADPRIVLSGCDDASLLVVGPARAGVGPWHVGSTTEWLLQAPPAPLLLARSGRPVRRVLVCADGSPHAMAAVAGFTALPWAADAEVTVVAVDDHRADVDAAVEAVVPLLEQHAVESSVVRRAGNPHRTILAEQRGGDHDVIVLGTRGLSRLERLRVGSTASAVARHAPCSVLVARAE